jgi:hypothetical protein
MSRLEALQHEIELLTDEEMRSLREWLELRDADEWDRQIEADVSSGKLDRLAEQTLREHAEGQSIRL